MSEAEQQYRALQQQHLAQLESALEDKEQQLANGKSLFDQLKQDFKYNLRLLQERDEELEQNDITMAQLRQQLNHQLHSVSELGIKLHEANEKSRKTEEELASREASHRKQLSMERSDFVRRVKEKIEEHSQQKLDWQSEKRALDEKLKVCSLSHFGLCGP